MSIIATVKAALTAEGKGIAKGRALEQLAEFAANHGTDQAISLIKNLAPSFGVSEETVAQTNDDLVNLVGIMGEQAKAVSHPRRWELLH